MKLQEIMRSSHSFTKENVEYTLKMINECDCFCRRMDCDRCAFAYLEHSFHHPYSECKFLFYRLRKNTMEEKPHLTNELVDDFLADELREALYILSPDKKDLKIDL